MAPSFPTFYIVLFPPETDPMSTMDSLDEIMYYMANGDRIVIPLCYIILDFSLQTEEELKKSERCNLIP